MLTIVLLRPFSCVVLLFLFLGCSAKEMPPGHLEPLGNSGTILPIDTVEGFLPPKQFIKKYLNTNTPVIMKQAAKTSPAYELWTDAYMRSKTPEGKEGKVFVEYGKKENRSEPSEDMDFKQFLDKYNKSDMYMVHHVPLFLQKDIIMPFSIQCDDFIKSFADTVMWFSSGGTKSVLHNDAYENINCLFRGRKRLIFVNITKYDSLRKELSDNKQFGHSDVDVERVDLNKYPFFAGMEFHGVEMEPGDCLYIPYQWFHHVESIGSNLAVNVWFFRKKNLDFSTCRDKPDTSLILSRFTYSMKDESEDSPPEEKMLSSKKGKGTKRKEDKYSRELVETVFRNLLQIVVPKEGNKASKTKFVNLMARGKKPSEKAARILDMLFQIADSNKNGKIDDVDVDAEISERRGKLLLKTIRMWQDIALKENLDDFDFFSASDEEKSADAEPEESVVEDVAARKKLPEFNDKIFTTIDSRDEL